jgi:hypothetical protein
MKRREFIPARGRRYAWPLALENETERCARETSHLTLRFTADVFPRFSSISYSTCCPSLSVVSPARSTAEMWTNTSFPPPLLLNESITLRRIEPFHCAARHSSISM